MRPACAALFQIAGMEQREIARKLNRAVSWVNKWCREEFNFEDGERFERPKLILTPQYLRKIKKFENKTGQSNRVVAKS